MPVWGIVMPLIAAALLAFKGMLGTSASMLVVATMALIGAVLAAVHHAEVIAHKLGEPLGTLVLTLAVTIIEAALIVSLMMAGGAQTATLARDAVYATIMIICTGVVGLCLLVGGWRHREQFFRVEGASGGLGALMALATLTLVLPTFTTTTREGTYSDSQLIMEGLASLVLWGVFVFVQTVRHRDYFLPVAQAHDEDVHAPPPSGRMALFSLGLLVVSLVSVVGLAKVLSPAIESGVRSAGLPQAVIGVAIALLVLLPETVAAIRSAAANRLQNSVNLALGSALASIGLTIPVVVVLAIWLDLPLVLGIQGKDLVLLVLAFGVSIVTFSQGRTTVLQGAVHVVVFCAFLFLTFVP